MEHQLKIIDSHTGGEPTRTIVEGGPDLGKGSMIERLENFRNNFDHFRKALVNEPRGSTVMVGALLCEPVNPEHAAGVIFFNNAGYLGMCGHGLIGLAVTLYYQGKIDLGQHLIETPVGLVTINMLSPNRVQFENVASYRFAKEVNLNVDDLGIIKGDIAWGGNWFYLVKDDSLDINLDSTESLLAMAKKIKRALHKNKITGSYGAEIDHIELFSSKHVTNEADSRNFVLCPGNEFDRSPCGTGTSAKLACLFEDGDLSVGQIWRQQGVVDSVFEGSVKQHGKHLIPSITGEAFVILESKVVFDANDPFRYGM
jgi:4-hydroxyproline epimerase